MSNYYSSRCLGSPSAGAAYPGPYQTPYPAYQQPAYVDPGAAIVTGAVIGGILSGALDGDREGNREHRGEDGRRFR